MIHCLEPSTHHSSASALSPPSCVHVPEVIKRTHAARQRKREGEREKSEREKKNGLGQKEKSGINAHKDRQIQGTVDDGGSERRAVTLFGLVVGLLCRFPPVSIPGDRMLTLGLLLLGKGTILSLVEGESEHVRFRFISFKMGRWSGMAWKESMSLCASIIGDSKSWSRRDFLFSFTHLWRSFEKKKCQIIGNFFTRRKGRKMKRKPLGEKRSLGLINFNFWLVSFRFQRAVLSSWKQLSFLL